jgi:8-oxo-dGTP pyrophosphatase MutT (NUDIX family)
MPAEISAGAVIYRVEGDKIYYLLLSYPAISHRAKTDYWDFAKGHIEKGESVKATILREVEEETGITDLKFAEGFKDSIKYFFVFEGKRIFKIVSFLLAKTNISNVKISFEHSGYAWLEFEEAKNRLTFANAKQVLQNANAFLLKNRDSLIVNHKSSIN